MEMEISRLVTALGLAVSQSQREIEQQAIRNFMDYFTRSNENASAQGEEGCLRSKSLFFCFPGPAEGETKTVEVPLAALALHGSMGLEKVKIDLKVTPRLEESGSVVTDLGAPENGGGPCGEEGHMELVFQRSEPAEGMARLYTELCKII